MSWISTVKHSVRMFRCLRFKAIAEDIHEQRRQLIKESEPDVRFDEDEEVFPPEGGEPEEGEQK